MAGLEAFAGVAAATDAQKAALGKFIAQQGSQGVDAWKAEAAVGQQMAADARGGVLAGNPGIGQPNMASAVGPGQLTQMLAARASQPGALMAQQGNQAAADFGAYTGLLGQANSNYGDAVKGAAPIVESQTRSQVAQIQAELAAKREAMQAEADARAQARADAQRERDWANQDRWLDLADDQRHRDWENEDRAAKEKEEEASTAGSLTDAAKRLGVSDKTRDTIAASTGYTASYNQVMKSLMPGMSQVEVEGLINNAVSANSGTPTGNRTMRALLAEQFANITGEPRNYQLREDKPPKDPDKDTGGGGGGGGFNLWNATKNVLSVASPIEGAATLIKGEHPVQQLLGSIAGKQGNGDTAAPRTGPPTTNGRGRSTQASDRPTPKGATPGLKSSVKSWDQQRIYDRMRLLDERHPDYTVLADELARRNGL